MTKHLKHYQKLENAMLGTLPPNLWTAQPTTGHKVASPIPANQNTSKGTTQVVYTPQGQNLTMGASKVANTMSDSNNNRNTFYFLAQPSQSSNQSITFVYVLINGKENIVTALLHRDTNTQRMHLHSVIQKENLLTPRVSKASANADEQNGSTMSVGQSAGQHDNTLTSTDVDNILQKSAQSHPKITILQKLQPQHF